MQRSEMGRSSRSFHLKIGTATPGSDYLLVNVRGCMRLKRETHVFARRMRVDHGQIAVCDEGRS